MVKPIVERTVRIADAVITGARRPQTLPTQLREVASGVVAGALYPLGWLDRGPGGRMRATVASGETNTPVLLVHGFLANKSNWWFVERELRAAGFSEIHAMNYSPRGADVDRLAEICVLRAHEVMAATGADRIHLVGHSLGGMVIRKAVQTLDLVEAASVVTVATPHGGVDVARLNALTGHRNTIGIQTRPGSPYLRQMWAEAHPMPDTRFIAYYSNLDLLVPGRRAMMLEPALAATNLLMKDQGHLSIVLSRRLARSVAEQLAAIEGLPGFGQPLAGLPADGVDEVADSAVEPAPHRRAAR
jgi:pimeloyl-ACP methyl ester carboxylesterase